MAPEPEVVDAALAGDFQGRRDALGLVVVQHPSGHPQDVAVVTAGQPAVARQDEEQGTL